jgi:hypothetical protein
MACGQNPGVAWPCRATVPLEGTGDDRCGAIPYVRNVALWSTARSGDPLEVRDFGRAVAQLGCALGDQMQLLKEPAQLSDRIFFISRGEDQQLHAWAVTNGEH